MRWLTCTPVSFRGGTGFFSRDSGLLSRGFRSLGIDSQAVMALPAKPEDLGELIRTEFRNLESPEWWRRQEADGVVLYAWGMPRFTNVARAIARAGCRLVLNQDSSGAVSPLAGVREWVEDERVHARVEGGRMHLFRFLAVVLYGTTAGIWLRDWRRAAHLKHGTVIGAVSPLARQRYRSYCRVFGGERLAGRVHVVPHPVAHHFVWEASGRKQPEIVAVGRWEAVVQKRPDLLCEAIRRFAGQEASARFHIVGDATAGMRQWREGLPEQIRGRVIFHGILKNDELASFYQTARVLFCPSSFESFHIASGEALCCGCSVAGARLSTLPSLQWFAERDGSLAGRLDGEALAEALRREWIAWKRGERNPEEISLRWRERLHARCVARKVLELTESAAPENRR